MDGSSVGGSLANIGGRVVGGLLAANDIQRGGFMNYLANRNALLQDPGFRASAGPFSAGLVELGGQTAPSVPPGPAANAMQQAGIQPGQYVANFPRLAPQVALEQQLLGAAGQGVGEMSQAERSRAGLEMIGVKHPTDPLAIVQALGGQWKPARVGPGGISMVPVEEQGAEAQPIPGAPGFVTYHGKPLRLPTAAGAAGSPKTEFQLYMADPVRWQQLQREKAQAAAGKTAATEEAKLSSLTSTTRTMIETAPSVMGLVKRINRDMAKVAVGPFAGRWQELWARKIGADDPDFIKLRDEMDLLTTALQRMHVGARGGDRMFDHFRDLLGQGQQSAANMQAALGVIEEYAQDKMGEAAGAQQRLRQRASDPFAPTSAAPQGGGGSDERTRQLDAILFPEGQ